MGHIITPEGVKTDPSNVQAVKNFPAPKNVKGVRSFLGLANYYRKFIPNFAQLARPINNLTKKDKPFVWDVFCDEAFEKIKQILTTDPILQYPDFDREFILTTDASNEALGAVLSQGDIPNDRPVAFASRTLNPAESRYSTIEKELLAVVWATKHFSQYLTGVKFTIVTDHKPLVWIFSVKDPTSRLLTFRLKLEEFDYKIIHKAGKYNVVADALSRTTITNTITEKINVITRSQEKQKTVSADRNINLENTTDNIPNTWLFTKESSNSKPTENFTLTILSTAFIPADATKITDVLYVSNINKDEQNLIINRKTLFTTNDLGLCEYVCKNHISDIAVKTKNLCMCHVSKKQIVKLFQNLTTPLTLTFYNATKITKRISY